MILALAAGSKSIAQLHQAARFYTPLETPYGFSWVGPDGSDGCFAVETVVGNETLHHGVFRFSQDGSAQWSRLMPNEHESSDQLGAWSVTSDHGLSYARAGGENEVLDQDSIAVVVCRMSPDGNTVWSRSANVVVPRAPLYLATDMDLDVNDDPHVLVRGGQENILLRFSADGEHQWSRRIPLPPGMNAVSVVADGTGGARVTCTTGSSSDQGLFMVMHFAADGSLMDVRTHRPIGEQRWIEVVDATSTPNGGMMVLGKRYTEAVGSTIFLMNTDDDGEVVSVNEYAGAGELLSEFYQGAVMLAEGGSVRVNFVHGMLHVDLNGEIIEARSLETMVSDGRSTSIRAYAPHFFETGGELIAGGQHISYDQGTSVWTTSPALLPLNADCYWADLEMSVTSTLAEWSVTPTSFDAPLATTLFEEHVAAENFISWLDRTELCDATSVPTAPEQERELLTVVPSVSNGATELRVHGGSDVGMLLFDAIGRPVPSHVLVQAGRQCIIDPNGLAPGVYVVVDSEAGNVGSRRSARFVVQ